MKTNTAADTRVSTGHVAQIMLLDAREAFMGDLDQAYGKFAQDGDMIPGGYNVEDFYYDKGCCQAIARDWYFVHGTYVVILVNCIYMGVNMDLNKSDQLYDADWFFIICENLFTSVFLVEWGVRLGAFSTKRNFVKDPWMVFDGCLVALMVIETWILSPITKMFEGSSIPIPSEPLRLLRMVRLTRLSRLIRNVPELVTLTTGLVQGVRASAASISMIFLFIYMFAIVVHALLKDEDELNVRLKNEYGVNFERLGDCMWVLLIDGTFMLDGTGNILSSLVFEGSFAAAASCLLMLMFIFLSAMVICNMLIGVLCEVVGEVTQAERNAKDISVLKDCMWHHLESYDDGDGRISKEEFGMILKDPVSKTILKELKVDLSFMSALSMVFFDEKNTHVPFHAVIELMLACRGDNAATVHTIANSMSFLIGRLNSLEKNIMGQGQQIFEVEVEALDAIEHQGHVTL